MVTDGRARPLTGAAVDRTAPAERDLRVGALRSSMRLALVSSGAHSPAVLSPIPHGRDAGPFDTEQADRHGAKPSHAEEPASGGVVRGA